MTEVPTSFETFYNPIVDMQTEYAGEIDLADMLAEHYIGDDDLKPSHILNVLANIDVNEIRNHGARLHHRAQEVYSTLQDTPFKELLTNSWQGGDAGAFEDYICGGGGHRGLDLYFEDVKAKTESHSMAFVNLGEDMIAILTDAEEKLVELFVDVRNGVYETEASGGGGILIDILKGGSAAIGVLAAIPGLGWMMILVIATVAGLMAYLSSLYEKHIQTENAARALMSDLEAAAGISEPDLASEQIEDLGVTEW
jgi:hypothetical protein